MKIETAGFALALSECHIINRMILFERTAVTSCKPVPTAWDSKIPEEIGTGSVPHPVFTDSLKVWWREWGHWESTATRGWAAFMPFMREIEGTNGRVRNVSSYRKALLQQLGLLTLRIPGIRTVTQK